MNTDSFSFRMQMKYLNRLHELGFRFLLSLLLNVITFGFIALLAYHEVNNPGIKLLLIGASLSISVFAAIQAYLLLRTPE